MASEIVSVALVESLRGRETGQTQSEQPQQRQVRNTTHDASKPPHTVAKSFKSVAERQESEVGPRLSEDDEVEEEVDRPAKHPPLADQTSSHPAIPEHAQTCPAYPKAAGTVAAVAEAQHSLTTQARTGTTPPSPLPVPTRPHGLLPDNPRSPIPENGDQGTVAALPVANKPLKRPLSKADTQLDSPPKRFKISGESYLPWPNIQLIPPPPKEQKHPPRSYFEWCRPAERNYVENYVVPMFFTSDYYSLFVKAEYYYLAQFRDWSLKVFEIILAWKGGLKDADKEDALLQIKECQDEFRLAISQLPVSTEADWVNAIPKIKVEALKRYHELVDGQFKIIITEESLRKLEPGNPGDGGEDILGRCRGPITKEAIGFCGELICPELSEYLEFWEPLITFHLNRTVEDVAKLRDETQEPREIPVDQDEETQPDEPTVVSESENPTEPSTPAELAIAPFEEENSSRIAATDMFPSRSPEHFESEDPPKVGATDLNEFVLLGPWVQLPELEGLGDWEQWEEILGSSWESPRTSSSLHHHPPSMERSGVRTISS